MIPKIESIGIIGAGNVAWHLTKVLTENSYTVGAIWNRSPEKLIDFESNFSIKIVPELKNLASDCDLIFLAISDSSIPYIAEQLTHYKGILVHTAGSVDISGLGNVENTGVFYPLQTLNRSRNVDFKNIPILIEAKTKGVLYALTAVADKISNHRMIVNSSQRLQIHTAAVFVNNFTNLMYSIGNHILIENEMPTDLLNPLIEETAKKAILGDPKELQTGPAKRQDFITINKHLEILSKFNNYSEIYSLLSRVIIEQNS